METISINEYTHLGDVIATLILAHNRAMKNNWIIKIHGPGFIKNLFDMFDFENLNYINNGLKLPANCSLIKLIPFKEYGPLRNGKATEPFLNARHCFHLKSKEDAEPITKIILPKTKLKETNKENVCCFQFDSRSIYYGKRQLTPKEVISSINRFKKNDKPVGIGGPETAKYNNFDYKLGFLNDIGQTLINSNQFVGIDSGISHLAGMLNVKSNIILTSTIARRQKELIEFYNIFYPNTTCHILDDIKNFKLLKMI